MALIALITSCNKTTPSAFWTNFHRNLITAKISDQGPRGGHREIHWKSEQGKPFTLKEVIEFASRNGWQLTDSLTYTKDSLVKLTNYSDKNYSFDILKENIIKRNHSVDNYILIFKTGWIAVEPGNARETEKNGFVQINSNGTELMIYHLWGE